MAVKIVRPEAPRPYVHLRHPGEVMQVMQARLTGPTRLDISIHTHTSQSNINVSIDELRSFVDACDELVTEQTDA